MVAWILGSALVCAICGALGALFPAPIWIQSYLYLAMAFAATVLFGAFDACEAGDWRGGGEEARPSPDL